MQAQLDSRGVKNLVDSGAHIAALIVDAKPDLGARLRPYLCDPAIDKIDRRFTAKPLLSKSFASLRSGVIAAATCFAWRPAPRLATGWGRKTRSSPGGRLSWRLTLGQSCGWRHPTPGACPSRPAQAPPRAGFHCPDPLLEQSRTRRRGR